MNFYTSDQHFFHANIIKYCKRPFSSVEQMNQTLINNWNKKVTNKDNVYILGDLSWGSIDQTLEILKQLKGRKYFIKGNHDGFILNGIRGQFEWVRDYAMIKDDGQKVVLFHYPIYAWDCQFHGSIHLYGHIHNNYEQYPELLTWKNAYNVGVEVNDYEPKTLKEILSL